MGENDGLQMSHQKHSVSLAPETMRNLSDLCAMIPPHAVTRELVEIYFSEANWYFALLEKYYFEKLYDSCYALNIHSEEHGRPAEYSKDLLYFPALLFQVLAVALQFAPLNTPSFHALGIGDLNQRDCLSSDFSTRGMEIVRIVGRHDPSIVAVQSDIMRALWLKNSSRGREAWHVLGGAIRLASQSSYKFQGVSHNLETEWLRI